MDIKMSITKIEADQLYRVSEEEMSCQQIAWAASKGFHALYIEREDKVVGYIDVKEALYHMKKNKKINFKATIQSQFISYADYEKEDNKDTFFKNREQIYVPLLKDHKLQGELVKVIKDQLPDENKEYWSLLNQNLLIEKLSHISKNIVVATLDDRTRSLYNLLNKSNRFNLSIYDMEEQQYEEDTVFIFYYQNRQDYYNRGYNIPSLYIKRNGTIYMTIDYLYFYMLKLTVLNFYKENDIKYYYVHMPMNIQLPDRIKKEFYPFLINTLATQSKWLDKFYGDNINRKFWESGAYKGVAIIKDGLGRCLKDYKSNDYNVIGGKRVTVGMPSIYTNSIHLFGPCIVRGAAVNDSYTIGSYLQQFINSRKKNWIRVVNHGTGGANQSIYHYYNMMKTAYRKGDIIIYFDTSSYPKDLIEEFNIKVIESLPLFIQLDSKRPAFINSTFHVTHIVNELLAKHIDPILEYPSSENNKQLDQDIKMNKEIQKIEEKLFSHDIEGFKEKLVQYRLSDYRQKKIGSIVMNCNPFTLGHLYLVQESLKYVDYLYIFIVEEDKSFFRFKDRSNLAHAACKQFENVKVIASDKFIISTVTFPEYFYKEENTEAVINPSKDIKIFGQEIAPVLNITVRLVGEEPIDPITAQYNQFLKDELPWYGIEVIEIPRKSIKGKCISASYVRRLIKEGKIEATKELVPPTTYQFIMETFK